MMPRNDRTPEADALDHALTALYQNDMDQAAPEGFATAWRAAIRREEQLQMKKQSAPHRFWKTALPVAAALVLVIGALCTNPSANLPTAANTPLNVSRASNYAMKADEAATPMADMAVGENADTGMADTYSATSSSASGSAAVPLPVGSKLVRTAELTLSTTQFEADRQRLAEQVAAVGGYVESEFVYGDVGEGETRTGNFRLRIPVERLDEFLSGAGTLARVTYQSQSAEDMSTQYSDIAARLQTQTTKMERLQTLLAAASQMSDILDIENAIADTQYWIESYQTQLNGIDAQANLSQVSVTLREESVATVAQTGDISLGERIGSGFAASLKALGRFFQNMLVFVVMASPVLIGLCALGVVIWLIARAKRRHATDREAVDPAVPSDEHKDTPPDSPTK